MKRRVRVGPRLALLAGAALACGSEPPPPEPDAAATRALSAGRVVGFASEDGAAQVWRGIPFAAPPVGRLRWRAPRPPEPWEGVREATAFGSPCVQLAVGLTGRASGGVTGSEDCLFLNVFAPRFEPDAIPSGERRLPVMLWIHGGGNTIGSADLYDFGRLAVTQDVIVVAAHYRLGAFGWFRHPALHAVDESLDDRSGNYGTLDLVAALEWVRDEIAAFGGDRGRVTVFGESAGGRNVYTLLLSRRARGLFQRAIVQSGSLRNHSVAEAENYRDAAEPGHAFSSSEVALALLRRRGAESRAAARRRLDAMPDAEVEALLRGADPAELLSAFDGSRFAGMYRGPFLVRDGRVLPSVEPMVAFGAGAYNRVPTILGSNRDEQKLFLLFSHEAVRRVFGLPLWLADERHYELVAGYTSRMWKAAGVDAPARAMARVQRRDVFAYRFDWDEEPTVLWADFSALLGAAHVVEIPFLLGRLDLGPATRFVFDDENRPDAERLAEAMQSYWGAFAHDGAPGRGRGGALPLWEAWNPRSPDGVKFAVIDGEADGGIRMSSEIEREDALVAEVARDERFASPAERCEVYAVFVDRSLRFDESDYAAAEGGACRERPLPGAAPEPDGESAG